MLVPSRLYTEKNISLGPLFPGQHTFRDAESLYPADKLIKFLSIQQTSCSPCLEAMLPCGQCDSRVPDRKESQSHTVPIPTEDHLLCPYVFVFPQESQSSLCEGIEPIGFFFWEFILRYWLSDPADNWVKTGITDCESTVCRAIHPARSPGRASKLQPLSLFWIYYFMCMSVFIALCKCTTYDHGSHRGQRMMSSFLDRGYRQLWATMWELNLDPL